MRDKIESLPYYKSYYLIMGLAALGLGIVMYFMAYFIHRVMKKRGIEVV